MSCFLRRWVFIVIFVVSIPCHAVLDSEQVLLQALFTSVYSFHVQPRALDNEFSENVYQLYLSWLDPQKRFFLKEDLSYFDPHRLKIDDEIQQGKFVFFDHVYERWIDRTTQLKSAVFSYIDRDVDLFMK